MTQLISSTSKAIVLIITSFTLGVVSLDAAQTSSGSLKPNTQKIANYTADTYKLAAKNALAEMVAIETVNYPEQTLFQNPAFEEFRNWVKQKASVLNLDFSDHGSVLIVSMGTGEKKLGLITHGDVQPANPSKWRQSPFSLDDSSEPGKWIGRGTEDDKGPIAAALYAMKSLKDQNINLSGKVELFIYMAEESDWKPLTKFLENYQPAPINIALDSEYPVVTAEKAWSSITLNFGTLGIEELTEQTKPILISFKGGSFRSQIPEEAIAATGQLKQAQIEEIERKLISFKENFGIDFTITPIGDRHIITVKGLSAHSSKPEQGVNAINFLAASLSDINWSPTPSSQLVKLIDDLVGTGYLAKKFGSIAYEDEFMGPLTLSPTLVNKNSDNQLELFINLRRPKGKSEKQLNEEINIALKNWQQFNSELKYQVYVGQPYWLEQAPHVPKLLNIFATFTNTISPQPIAIGGSTNAKLFPQAVSFGPSMPNTPYTGHSEKEYITEENFTLTLKMYTAMIYELATGN
ncbi:MAG: dipeptidase [Gammaproteobacteria bacterium]|nr:dipeptidase [Gammaproteobacteria bacterium]